MNNKETLQSYNGRLTENGITLNNILGKINNLPEAGVSEDLTEELTAQDTKITTQETKIEDIIYALRNKVDPGILPEPEPDYIQDGLVAWWDGEDAPDENNYWRSRVGDDYIYQYKTAFGSTSKLNFKTLHSIIEKSYKNNSMYGLVTNKDYLVQGYTIEVVGKATSTANNTDINSSNGGATLIAFNKSNSPYVCVTGKETEGWYAPINADASAVTPVKYSGLYYKRHTFALHLTQIIPRGGSGDTQSVSYSMDGKDWLQTTPISCATPTKETRSMTVMCYYDSSYYSSCEVNSIRVYNRKLTEEELRHNYEVDKARFDLDEYEG